MLPAFLIIFRESLEAVLIVGIIVAFLRRTKAQQSLLAVWRGVGIGIFLALVFGWWFAATDTLFGLSHPAFEGLVRLLAGALLIYMIVWMAKQGHVVSELEARVKARQKSFVGIESLVALSVLREGVETVIFLRAAVGETQDIFQGGVAGILGAMAVGYLFFLGAKQVPLRQFFRVTNVLLSLFAAGILSSGVGLLQSVGALPLARGPIWDTSGLLDPSSLVGQLAHSLFGYTPTPTGLMVLTWLGILILIALLFRYLERVHRVI